MKYVNFGGKFNHFHKNPKTNGIMHLSRKVLCLKNIIIIEEKLLLFHRIRIQNPGANLKFENYEIQ